MDLLFNVIWWYARNDHRLIATTLDSAGVAAISRRFRLALAWLATGTLLGLLLPPLGMAVIAVFIPYYWPPSQASSPRRSADAATGIGRNGRGPLVHEHKRGARLAPHRPDGRRLEAHRLSAADRGDARAIGPRTRPGGQNQDNEG
ncbi:hypothetical protein [Streptomyces sp. NEAU-YJ-81]|uniref:hypothetical protein n=1 Tax=Streptomyces sp. NEAU-YJ-81 TaxID=2820288 RepID=UPI001ABCD790|nr:hypothetical protein [Streptomyces sp. NEAU-YJ-81]MBO3673928.1 hypothetical protein [Streptomyces sp. NEAU-YJ-81]